MNSPFVADELKPPALEEFLDPREEEFLISALRHSAFDFGEEKKIKARSDGLREAEV
jgi:hypothetical protein